MSTTLTAADIRKVRPFKMEDEDLAAYGEMAVTLDPFGIESSSAIATAKKATLFALLAAHLATILREPEPSSTRLGDMTVSWNQGSALTKDALSSTGPGALLLTALSKLNRGWVLR